MNNIQWWLFMIAFTLMLLGLNLILSNTKAIKEQTAILGRCNIIQASERVEEVVLFEQREKTENAKNKM